MHYFSNVNAQIRKIFKYLILKPITGESVKVLKNKGRTIIVATDDMDLKNKCPRLIVNEGINEIRDDYKGSIKVSRKLLHKIF